MRKIGQLWKTCKKSNLWDIKGKRIVKCKLRILRKKSELRKVNSEFAEKNSELWDVNSEFGEKVNIPQFFSHNYEKKSQNCKIRIARYKS